MASACGGGGGAGGPLLSSAPPELLVCRARVDSPHRYAEIALRSTRNLGTGRVGDRNGPELGARLHDDGVRIVFARERFVDDPDSRELYLSTIDGSTTELRLTVDTTRDDSPVWSSDGERILFVSERAGDPALYTMDATGADVQPFLLPPAGAADVEPDWHGGTDRIVFSRRDAGGHHVLWLVHGDGSGAVALTDGGATVGDGNGDRQAAFAPDGQTIVFVRRSSAATATLCLCDVATGAVTVRYAPTGEVAWPRIAPTADRIWFGLAEPGLGRQTLRLAHVPLLDGDPTLLWPDERWRYQGLDFLPAAPAAPDADPAERLDVTLAEYSVAAAANAFGGASQFVDDDGNEYYLRTIDSGGRQLAAINGRFDLPVAEPDDALEVHVTVKLRTSRADGDSVLRISLRNPVDSRYDTAVELPVASTDEQTLAFRTSSLRHVSSANTFQFNVIADLAPGAQADVWIDLIEVLLVPRAVE